MLTQTPKPFGFNVIGHVTGNLGLGVAARNTLHMLRQRDERFCVVDIDAGWGRSGHDDSFMSHSCEQLPAPFAVNVFHTNPGDLAAFLNDHRDSVSFTDKLNVGVPFWELPLLPQGLWRAALSAMDVVLAPTHHIEVATQRSCPEARVLHYPQAVFLPAGIAADRERWGIPDDAFVCLVVMDLGSDVERKNPWAALEAFERAFGDAAIESTQLIVKLNNARMAGRFSRATDEILQRLGRNPQVRVIEKTMSYRDVLSLSASADVYLSLHRAEGLGLNLMEAMTLGRVVVGTGWSGNLDFMTKDNSVLVPFTMRPVESSHPSYKQKVIGPGQEWADPSVDEAARALRLLYGDPELRYGLGERARSDMELRRQTFLRGEIIDHLLEMVELGAIDSDDHRERARQLQKALRLSPYLRARRVAGRTLRRLRLRP